LDRSGQASKIQAGEYELSPSQTLRQIADSLAAGRTKNKEISIKLIEGQTMADFARKLAADGVSPDFATLCRTQLTRPASSRV
jgi:cell division protein YceG involved in septum cleavage